MRLHTRLFPVLLSGILLLGCSQKTNKAPTQRPLNLLVLLDLSDRLTTPEQINRDTQLLHHIYRLFHNRVRQQLYINSTDRLQILLAPQRSLPVQTENMETRLRVYLPDVPMKERAAFLRTHEPLFFSRIDSLYHIATTGRKPEAYSGSDIWKFFDQHLNLYLRRDTNAVNKIIILTDGYFDFELLKDKKQKGCRYSYSELLMRQARTGTIPLQQLFDSCGLLPVTLNQPNISVMVTEISPKTAGAGETRILKTMWGSWLKAMHIGSYQLAEKSELNEVKEQISTFIGNK